jgi:two-component system response regulator HydG
VELPLPIRQKVLPSRPAGEGTLKEMEREWIANTLTQMDGNRTRAAKILGITRKTLQNKIKEYDLNL